MPPSPATPPGRRRPEPPGRWPRPTRQAAAALALVALAWVGAHAVANRDAALGRIRARAEAALRQRLPEAELGQEVSVDSTTWNRRYREYMDKIKTGSVFEIAEVLRDLYLLRSDKDLSFGERKMLDTARSLLIKELAIAKDCDEQDVETDLKKIFNIT